MMSEVPASASPALGPRARLNKNVVTAKAAPQGAGDVWPADNASAAKAEASAHLVITLMGGLR